MLINTAEFPIKQLSFTSFSVYLMRQLQVLKIVNGKHPTKTTCQLVVS